MRLLKTTLQPGLSPEDILATSPQTIKERQATRAIVLRGEDILLLYTQRYDDFSLPGGGIDDGEDHEAGLIRELQEETGATGVRNVQSFGRYEEYRSWYKDDADILHIISHCYQCEIDDTFGETAYESYEVTNGMSVHWKNIHVAIEHNEKVIASSEKKGLSIERETFLLKVIAEELVSGKDELGCMATGN